MKTYLVKWLLRVWKSVEVEAESEEAAIEKFNPYDPNSVEIESEMGDYMEAVEVLS